MAAASCWRTPWLRSLAAVAHLAVLVPVLLLCGSSAAAGQLEMGYYNKTCPRAEEIVFTETVRIVRASPDLAASLLRLHYHDCFVQGCDASVLLDSTEGNVAEKDSKPNKSLRGFDSVARVKDKLEKACPATVSCADVLALMARDAVVLAKGPSWPVVLGRRDGRTSSAGNCGELPPLYGNITIMIEVFAAKGLDVKDVAVLSGAHTLGKAHCPSFADRLYASSGAGRNSSDACSTDPALYGAYADRLRQQCRGPDDNSTAEMDPGSCRTFDTSYYRHVARRRGLLRSDASLMDHPFTRAYVRRAATGRYDGHFFRDFRDSMAKMGAIGVLTGDQGEIRTKCNLVNN